MSTVTAAADRSIYSPIQKDRATFLETSEESGGERTLLEIELAAGGGNAPHRHLTYAEHFEAVEGTLTVVVDGRRVELAPGETAVAEAGVVHNFTNPTGETVVFRVELRPGHRGFERALQAGYGIAADGRARPDGIPKNPIEAAVLLKWSDLRLTGAQRAMEPLLGLLAAIGRLRGVDKRLAERYVRI